MLDINSDYSGQFNQKWITFNEGGQTYTKVDTLATDFS